MTRSLRTRLSARATTAALTGTLLVGTAAVGASPAVAHHEPTTAYGEHAVNTGASHIGKPYRYGATGPDAFDCSGFVQHTFRQAHGLQLPRTSADQYAVSQKVPQDQKRRGDLIAMFNSRGQVTHVGIYAGDDSWVVASTGAGKVIHQRLYSSNYGVGRFGS